jgi:hypothetical protein
MMPPRMYRPRSSPMISRGRIVQGTYMTQEKCKWTVHTGTHRRFTPKIDIGDWGNTMRTTPKGLQSAYRI